MAEEIESETGIKPTLIQGGGGVFDVVVDGKLVYSKKQTGRFPEPFEVTKKLPRDL